MKYALRLLTLLLLYLTVACTPAGPVSAPTVTPPPQPTPNSNIAPVIQNSARNINRSIRFEHIGLEQGLSQSVVNAIFQDSKGFLWIGTQDGLNRYNGYDFTVYKPEPENEHSLSDRWITSIVEDKDGFLWIGTRQGGLNRFDPRSGLFTVFRYDPNDSLSLSNNRINALLVDKDGLLWVGTDRGLDRLNANNIDFTHIITREGDQSNPVTALYQDRNGYMWIGIRGSGLLRFNVQKGSSQTYTSSAKSTGLSNNNVTSIEEDAQGNLWIGTRSGLNRFTESSQSFTHYYHQPLAPESLVSDSINHLYVDHNGILWIATSEGLDVYNAQFNQFIHYHHEPVNLDSLSNNFVSAVYEDRGSVMWVGTWGGGVNKYNRKQDDFAYYRSDPLNPQSLSGNLISAIFVEPTGGIVWIGTSDNGLNRFNSLTSEFKQFHHDPANPDSLSSDQIYSIFEDAENRLWVGTSKALDLLDPGTGTAKHYIPGDAEGSLSGLPVYSIYEDHFGNLWFGTGDGLDRFDPQTDTFIPYRHDPENEASLGGEQISAITEDWRGNLWVGTWDGGLNRFDRASNGFVRYQNSPRDGKSLSNNTVLSVYQSHEGVIWVGTAGGGLNRYDAAADNFTAYTEEDGLPNNVIYGILEDRENHLWLSTNYGLSRFDPRTLNFRNYTVSDGLQSNEFNSNAYAITPRGEMYFGGINGMNFIDPLSISTSAYVPSVVLTSLTQNGEPVKSDTRVEALQEITLHWPQNSFEFEFAALSYGQPNKNQYAYKLENFENDWNYIGTKHNSRYTNLPGGTYTLLLKGSNSDGVWNDTPLQIKVTVVPPVWQTNWFRILLGLGLASIVVAGYGLRIASVQRRSRQLERVVQERTGELKKRNTEMEALYQADEKIIRTVSINQVFQALVNVAVEILNADRSMVLAWDEEETHLVPRVSSGFKKKTLDAMTFTKGESPVGRVLATGEPVVVTELDLDDLRPDLRDAVAQEGIRSFAHLPIKVDEKVIGVFNVAFTRPNAITDDTIRLYTALVQRAALSIANMQLFEQTKDLAVMEERNRLARDLHDSAKQKAFAALAQLGTVNSLMRTNTNGIKPHITEAETLVYEVIQELTFLIQEIYPIALQEKGLATTLREYIFEWENRNDTEVHLMVRDERPLPLETEQAIYRVIQEALANVSRHSRARHVDVSLVYTASSLQVTIADDGCGFDTNQKAKGMGFRSMRERLGSIRGTIQTRSAVGEGTCVTVQIPIKPAPVQET